MYTMLVVDDEALIRNGMRRAIEKLDLFTVEEAASGRTALEIIETQPVDAMFLDISMADMNGLELMRALSGRAGNPLTVIISGYEAFDYAKQALQYGAIDYILKPIDSLDVTALGTRLAALLDEKSAPSAPQSESAASPSPENHRRITELVRDFIDQHYQDNLLSVGHISAHLSYTANYIGNAFKKRYGMTVNDYINKVRVENAKRLMDETELMLYEIAFRVGYNDQHYFSKIFKKYEGISATEYRQK